MNQKRTTLIVVMSAVIAMATWYFNHKLGLGSVVASGLVGVAAGLILPGDLAGPAYIASLVGMSGTAVIPSLAVALLGGVIVGFVTVFTGPVYGGMGGKAGTTATTSVLITRGITKIFGL